MASIIANGKYRLVETICSTEGYSAHKGIDIQSRGNAAVLVNCYASGPAIKSVVGDLHRLTPELCQGFLSVCVQEDTFYAIFDFPSGKPLDTVFSKKEYPGREEAYCLAEILLHQILLMASFSTLLANAASNPEHVLIHRESGGAYCRMLIPPDTSKEPAEVLYNLSVCMELIFRRRFGLFDFELDFLDELQCEGFESVSALYAAWRDVQRQWEEVKGQYQKMLLVKRFFHLAGQKWRRRKRAKAYRERLELLDAAAEQKSRQKDENIGI